MEYLIPISILLFIASGVWATNYVGRKKDLTISQHVAQSQTTQIVFGIIGAIATLLASWSLFGWLLPHYQANLLSYIVFGLVMLGFLIAALVPYIKNTRRGTLHNIAAWGMCYIIPLALFAALFWPINNLVRVSGVILLIALLVLLILFATRKELKRSMLLFQSTYLALFFIFLLLVTIFI